LAGQAGFRLILLSIAVILSGDCDSSMAKGSRARAADEVATRAKAPAANDVVPLDQPNPFFIHWRILLAGGLIVLAGLVAYYNSFSGGFIFDDRLAITENSTIRQLGSALSPPFNSTAGGRPIFNLSLAVNHAFGGLAVEGYHKLNLTIHIIAALALFGIVRRTLLCLDLSRCGRGALTPRECEIPRCTRNDNLRGEGTPPTTSPILPIPSSLFYASRAAVCAGSRNDKTSVTIYNPWFLCCR
jgi:hypothetical protein